MELVLSCRGGVAPVRATDGQGCGLIWTSGSCSYNRLSRAVGLLRFLIAGVCMTVEGLRPANAFGVACGGYGQIEV